MTLRGMRVFGSARLFHGHRQSDVRVLVKCLEPSFDGLIVDPQAGGYFGLCLFDFGRFPADAVGL
jgi:hypothetical protein